MSFKIKGSNKVAGVSAMRGVSINTGKNVEAALRTLAKLADVSVNSLANQAFEFVLEESAELLAEHGIDVSELNYPRTTAYRQPRAGATEAASDPAEDQGSTQDNGAPGLTLEPTVVDPDSDES